MPVTSQVRRVFGDNDKMKRARGNGVVAPRADVFLARLIGLDRGDGYLG